MGNYFNQLNYSSIKTPKQQKKEEQTDIINADIKLIDDTLESGSDEETLKKLHMYIDGKYCSYIPNWGISVFSYVKDYGFNYSLMQESTFIHNLNVMKAKLEGYLCDFPVKQQSAASENNISLSMSNSNEVNVAITFENAKQKIDDMTELSDSDVEELKKKIDELEIIINEKTSKRRKWEKIKPIVSFALDKGADVAITIMGLVLQKRMGL